MQNGSAMDRESDFLNSEEAVRVLADAFCSSIFGSKVPGGVFTATVAAPATLICIREVIALNGKQFLGLAHFLI